MFQERQTTNNKTTEFATRNESVSNSHSPVFSLDVQVECETNLTPATPPSCTIENKRLQPLDDKSIFQRAHDLIDRTSQPHEESSSPADLDLDRNGLEETPSILIGAAVARAKAKGAGAFVGTKGNRSRSSVPGAQHVRSRAPGLSPAFYLRLVRLGNMARSRSRQAGMEEQCPQQGQRQQQPDFEEAENNNDSVSAVAQCELADTSRSNTESHSCFKRTGCRKLHVAVIIAVFTVVTVIVSIVVLDNRNSSRSTTQSVTTEMSPLTLSCDNWQNQAQPNVITQCNCAGRIAIVADDVAANYRIFKFNDFIQDMLPSVDNTMESCDPTNQALVWLASATGMPAHQERTHFRQRYILALLFIVWNGAQWTYNDGWQSSADECKWKGVHCDSSGIVNAIDLHDNHVSGDISSYFPLLTSLKSLVMNQNELQGSLPSTQMSTSLSNLNILNLENNFLTGAIPSELSELSQLKAIMLAYNQLTGTIPTSIGQLQLLTALSLTNNTLAADVSSSKEPPSRRHFSTIPTELGLLTRLQRLELAMTGINGTFPTELLNLGGTLQVLDLSRNSLVGTIPSKVDRLLYIEQVTLDHNSLSGTIPVEFGSCTNLVTLDLSSNRLNGTLPAQLGTLTKLVFLSVKDNMLTGDIPPKFCNLDRMNFCQFNPDTHCHCCVCPSYR